MAKHVWRLVIPTNYRTSLIGDQKYMPPVISFREGEMMPLTW
jgi:hypothetical protein